MDYENGGDGGNFASPGGGTPSGDGNRRKATEEQILVPVTIAMLLKAAKNNNILEDGRDPNQIKLVAAMRDVTKSSASNTYIVEDGTGVIEVKEWNEDGNLIKAQISDEAAVEHQYVRIIGKLDTYNDNPQVVANTVRKLQDGNELTYHLLEVVHAGEKYKQGGQIVGSPSMGIKNMNFGGMQASTPLAVQNTNQGGGQLEAAVTNFLNAASEEVGGSMITFINENQGMFSEAEIRAKFNDWAGEGIIYSTIDDDHYSIVN